MDKFEIKELVLKTSSDLYLRQQSVEESFVDDSLREDSDEVIACKKLIKEALTIPTFHMNTIYGYNKAINNILEHVDKNLGTEDQNSIISYTENTIAALQEAIKQNKEFFGIDEDSKVDNMYKSIREDLEAYKYESVVDLCENVDTMLRCYIEKVHDAMKSNLDKMEKLNEITKALENAGINESAAHSIEHLLGEFNNYMVENAKKDDRYILKLFEDVVETRVDDIINSTNESFTEEKESIESVFGEGFYDNKE